MRLVKNTILMVWLLCAASALLAQAPATATPAAAANPEKLYDTLTLIFYIAAGVLFIVSLWAMLHTNQVLYKAFLQQQAGLNTEIKPEEVPTGAKDSTDSFWVRLRKKYWEDPIPIAREQEIMLKHGFDGIRELDNSLPPWWVNLFYLTIAWSLVYMIYYHWGGGGPSSIEEYQKEMETARREVALALASKADAVDENTVEQLTDAAALADGKTIYTANCVACHGAAGEGGVGPNLADEYWIHGGGIKNVFKTVKYGVPEKGMIAWSSTLRPSDIQKVSSYLLTFQGTQPPNAKAPQGEKYVPEKTSETK